MTITTGPVPIFKEKHSITIRIWHWCAFLTITCSLITVLLASTFFTTRDNISMVQDQLQKNKIIVSLQQARGVAHEYNDKLWMLHKYIGYGLCILLLARILIEAFLSKEETLRYKLKAALKPIAGTATAGDKNHYLLVKIGYLIFYIILLIMTLTGLGLAYEDVPFFKAIHKSLSQLHSIIQYLVYFYILAHLIGVIRADVTGNPGIVSGMIHGKGS